MKRKFITIILIVLLCFLTSCQKDNKGIKDQVNDLLELLEQKYPNHLCWNNGWYEAQYYENEYSSSSIKYKHINVNCYIDFFTDEHSNNPTMNVNKFYAKKIYNDSLRISISEEMSDGIQYYNHMKNYYYYSHSEENNKYFITNDFIIKNQTAIGPFTNNISQDFVILGNYSYVETYESDNLIVYKKIIQFDPRYAEMEFHFDKDLNLLKYQISYEGRTKGSSIINTITTKTYTLIIYPSKEVSIEIPKNVENNVDELNTNLSIKDIFMNINGLWG